MKTFNNFLTQHGTKTIIVLLFLIYLKTCTISSGIGSIKKDLNKLDSVPTRTEVKTAIQVEGLKAEKRMIQSTDRKILDVNRQAQIDQELKALGEK